VYLSATALVVHTRGLLHVPAWAAACWNLATPDCIKTNLYDCRVVTTLQLLVCSLLLNADSAPGAELVAVLAGGATIDGSCIATYAWARCHGPLHLLYGDLA
jgi:hypothetical protein